MNKDPIIAQAIGAGADRVNMIRQEELEKALILINADETAEMVIQDKNFAAALLHMQKVKEFIDHPEHILGNRTTKHGEIAEQIEVGITNAEAALRGIEERAVIDPEIVGRTVNAPVDYYIDGIPVQSKYIASRYGELYHILEHFKKYDNEQFDVAGGGYVHCPPEYMETFMDILSKSPEELGSEEKTLLNKIHEIETRTGKKFEEVVRPGRPSYEDVQLSNAPDTVRRYTEELSNDNEQIKAEINDKAEQKRTVAIEEHAPSLAEAGKVAAIGAAVSGGLTLAIDVYKKKKEGKKISDFDAEDWKELGLDTGKGSLKGGVTGASVYALTNLANMSAPMASGYTSAAIGVLDLLNECRKGEMDFATFIDMSEVLCTETAITTIGSAVGQMIIPIPVVGAVIGSVSANILGDIIKDYGTSEEKKLVQEAAKRQKKEMARLSVEHQVYIERMDAEYGRIRSLQEKAFDMTIDSGSRLEYSRQLAVECGVEEKDIFQSIEDIDAFFLGE